MLSKVFRKIVGTQNDRRVRSMYSVVEKVNALEEETASLSNSALAEKAAELKGRIPASVSGDELNKTLDDMLPETFALVREASRRATGMRHFDVQIIGAIVLHGGAVAEMKTGEGKTLVAVPALCLNALAGKGAHLVTVNDYLAGRDALWMAPVYKLLGLEVGVVNQGSSYRVEWENPESAEQAVRGGMSVWVGGENGGGADDLSAGRNLGAVSAFRGKLVSCSRREAYACDVTYGTNNEFGFDYLRDNMGFSLEDYVQREHFFAIVDEVDSILIDEARTPLIISGPSGGSTDIYYKIDGVVGGLARDGDFSVDEKNRRAELFESGISKVESALGIKNLYDPANLETLHCVNQALRARHLFHRDVDYMVRDGKVVIVDEFTGRLMEGRRWSDGLHQAVEAKEKAEIEQENQTLATITLQNYFRMYEKLSGMTGTADTEAFEFQKIYELEVTVVPTHREMVRKDFDDVVYRTGDEKLEAICSETKELNSAGRPVLIGTTSIEQSEKISDRLKKRGIAHEVLNAKNHAREAEIIAQAGRRGAVTIATNMAGRGTDIVLGGNPEFLAKEITAKAREENGGGEDAGEKSLAEAQAAAEAGRKEVVGLGGLHIIGSERHESRRIDNQLRGRSGRQGDPGSSRFYISLEDPLMRIFASERVASVMDMVGWEKGVPMEHGMMTRVIESAQKKVESRNFDIRKHLLDYDDVLNTQRGVIYELRRAILEGGEALKENFLSIAKKLAADLAAEISGPDGKDNEAVMSEARSIFNLGDGPLEGGIEEAAAKRYGEKESELGAETAVDIQRFIMLQTIDHLWKDHLLAMDHLREGIGLRGYAQKDPLYEYKNEGFEMFSDLVATYEEEVCSRFFSVRLAEEEDVPTLEEQREAQDLFLSSGGEEAAAPSPQVAAPVRRQEKKVGRNDPCPCGSGKKYKRCCGG